MTTPSDFNLRKEPAGCDIPEPPPFSDVVDALAARAKARRGAWAAGFRRWGSASWGRAWALGVGLIAAGGLALTAAALTIGFLGRWAASLAGADAAFATLPAVGLHLATAALGVGALGLAVWAARGLIWLGVEGPIRLWSRFSLGVSGSPSRASRHCFAPWTPASMLSLALCVPAAATLAFWGDFDNKRSQPAASLDGSAPGAELRQRQSEAAWSQAKTQMAALAAGRVSELSDTDMDPDLRALFWSRVPEAWSAAIDRAVQESARLSAPGLALEKNAEGMAKDRQRLAELAQERARLINGYWVSLGMDREAPRLAQLRSVGASWVKGPPASKHERAYCLPMPNYAHNAWIVSRGGLSSKAQSAMALYFNSRPHASEGEPLDVCAMPSADAKASLITFGSFLKVDAHWVDNDDPRSSESKTTWTYNVMPVAQSWTKGKRDSG